MGWFSKSIFSLTIGGILSAALWAIPVSAESGWEAITAPNTGGGLVLSPKMSGAGTSHPFLAWAGTGEDASFSLPEFTFSVLRGNEWSKAKAPFFGKFINNVRCLALGMARYTVGAIYMRNTDQSKTTFEVLFTGSSDKGWSFATPEVADSFSHEESSGTDVACAGVGGKKPMFALGWLSENRAVKVGLWNPATKADRPRAEIIGRYGRTTQRLELAGVENGGFVAAWNDGRSLMTTYLAPLVGNAEKASSLIDAKIGYNFCLTDYKGRNPKIVFELPKLRKGDGARRQVWAFTKDKKWERIPAAAPSKGERPAPSRLEACQDEDGNIHVASLPKTGDQILYSRLVDGKFTEPEVAIDMHKVIGVTGFDIAYVNDYVYITAAQGPYMYISRCKVK